MNELLREYYDRKWAAENDRYVRLGDDGRARMLAIREQLESYFPNGPVKILDYGCGTGWLAAYLPRRFFVTGVDISTTGIELARRLFPEYEFICASVFDDVLGGRTFDAVVSQEVIEHLPRERQAEYLKRCAALLDSSGILVLTTPNKWALVNMRRTLGRPLDHLGEQPVENPLTVSELRMLAEQHFRVIRLYTVFDPVAHCGLHRILYSLKLRRLIPGWKALPHLLNAKLHTVLVAQRRA